MVNTSERGMRERERTHSTRTNLWCRLTNQKVLESPVGNCNIPAEITFSIFEFCASSNSFCSYELTDWLKPTFSKWIVIFL